MKIETETFHSFLFDFYSVLPPYENRDGVAAFPLQSLFALSILHMKIEKRLSVFSSSILFLLFP
ncbi:hypothetical protein HQ39_09120 [Porphyromonas sp. COT-108 OH2963]|nr:hypothetical protein HQ39_09120 [Porphyromonas sp. COT-108 OH2963]